MNRCNERVIKSTQKLGTNTYKYYTRLLIGKLVDEDRRNARPENFV